MSIIVQCNTGMLCNVKPCVQWNTDLLCNASLMQRNAVCLCTVNHGTMERGKSKQWKSVYNITRTVYAMSILVQWNAGSVCNVNQWKMISLCNVNPCTMERGQSVHCQSLYSGTRSVYALSIIVQWSAVSQCTVKHCTMERGQSIQCQWLYSGTWSVHTMSISVQRNIDGKFIYYQTLYNVKVTHTSEQYLYGP